MSTKITAKITANSPRKPIGGFEHVQVTCEWCKLPVWTQPENLTLGGYVCRTCVQANLHPTMGGGIRVIRKGEPMS